MRLGIFGGTFDPLHIGHLIVADDAAAALRLDRVHFVPAGDHPLKGGDVEAPGRLRLQMVEAATEGSERFIADGRELGREGPSYTIDTVEEIAVELPGAEIFLLVGSDILAEIHLWREARRLARRARLVVMSRAGVEAPRSPEVRIEHTRVEVTNIGISSTDVRERIRANRPFRYLVPAPVYRIIEEYCLYRTAEARQSGEGEQHD